MREENKNEQLLHDTKAYRSSGSVKAKRIRKTSCGCYARVPEDGDYWDWTDL